MSPSTVRPRTVVRACTGGLLAIALLAGCSSETAEEGAGTATSPAQTGSPTAAASSDACAAAAQVKASLRALVETNIAQEGTNTLRTRLATLESDVQALIDSGRAELAPKTTTVKDSLTALGEVLKGLKENPTAAQLAQVKPSLTAVRTSVEDLIAAIEGTC